MMRPRGKPPQPRAMSSASEPVGMTVISGSAMPSPRRMIAPFPYCFSMLPVSASMAAARSPRETCEVFDALLLSSLLSEAIFVLLKHGW